jgi:hypothetical protein
VLFSSPSKVQKARELQDVKEAAKEREALDKVSYLFESCLSQLVYSRTGLLP